MLYGKADQEQAVAALAGAPAYANQFVAPSKQALNGHASAPWITGEQSGSEQVAASPGTGREGPLNISWRGQSSYEEARTGRIFNLRRPERYPAAVLNAESVSEGATPCLLHCSCIRAVAISFITQAAAGEGQLASQFDVLSCSCSATSDPKIIYRSVC